LKNPQQQQLGMEQQQNELPEITREIDNLLSKIYYNPIRVGSLGGVTALQNEANLSLKKSDKPTLSKRTVETWLSTQPAYYLHKHVSRRRFKRNKILYGAVGDLMQSDIVYFADIAKYRYKYLLLVLDTASRYIFYRFMITKTCKETTRKIKEIFKETKLKRIYNLMTDFDGAYYGREMQEYLKSIDCNHYSIKSGEYKVPTLDRYIRQMQDKLSVYYDRYETRNWVKAVPQIISSMNRSYNRIIKMTPKQAWNTLPRGKFDSKVHHHKIVSPWKEKLKFRPGDTVSILGLPPSGLHHAYKGKWTLKRYRIERIKKPTDGSRPLFYLVDANTNEDVTGSFYQNELSHARAPGIAQTADWLHEKRIEKVLKRKTVKGVKMVLVRYKLLGPNSDEWIKESDVRQIQPQRVKHRKKKN
jgi:hypothetical protein